MSDSMQILGIESSCDETAVAIYDAKHGLLAHHVYSQIALHQAYGGVVPELASRDHSKKLLPLVKQLLKTAQLEFADLDGVAYTAGPGLAGALLVGAAYARSLAYALQIPAIAVHHMEGHLLAPLLEHEVPEMPFVALLVSGGHTLLVKVTAIGDYEILGQSVDDAAGEAFDKTAKLLQLGYPGGPKVAALANSGRPGRWTLPRPMLDRPGLDFSYSGLKTAVVLAWQQCEQTEQDKADLAYAFQDAVVDTLLVKCQRALEQTHTTRLVMAGGVSANQLLRERLTALATQRQWQIYYPRLEFCTDNAAMIALTGCHYLQQGYQTSPAIKIYPRWPLTAVSAAYS